MVRDARAKRPALLTIRTGRAAAQRCVAKGEERRASAPDRLLRLAEYFRREGGKALEQLLDLLGRGRVDVEPDLVGLGAKILVLHGGEETLAQRLETIGGDAGRACNSAAEQELLEMHVEHRA